METFDQKWLQRAEYSGSVAFYSYDPKGIANPSGWDVVDNSIIQFQFCDNASETSEYFYAINKNTCQVFDYIDYHGIWIAYVGMHGRYGAVGLRKVEWVLVE